MMIDCGHSRNLNWQPGDYLRSQNIWSVELMCITNYDEDHVSGVPNILRRGVDIKWLLRNKSVSASVIKKLETDSDYGPGIDALMEMIGSYTGEATESNPLPEFEGVPPAHQRGHCFAPWQAKWLLR